MKKFTKATIGLCALAIVGTGGYALNKYFNKKDTTNPPVVEQPEGEIHIANLPSDWLCYNYSSNTYQVTKGNSELPVDVVIPSTYDDGENGEALVTSIDDFAFCDCYNLTSVVIPNTIINIGGCAFSSCPELTSLIIPASVKSISENSFMGCNNLSSIVVEDGNSVYDSRDNCNAIIETTTNTLIFGCQISVIPDTVTTIGYSAFSGSPGLRDLTIPNSVTTIRSDAFSGCFELTSLTIPASVTTIETNVFNSCSSLSNIVVEEGNSVYDSRDNCNAIIETATNTLILGCQLSIIPDTVTTIADFAFSSCIELTSLTIPASVKSIFDNSFMGCNNLSSIIVEDGNPIYDSRNNCNAIIETATNTLILGCQLSIIPDTVTTIGHSAFMDCEKLTSIIIPSSVVSIKDNAFLSCDALTSVTISSNVTNIGEGAFIGCIVLSSITIEAPTPPTITDNTFDFSLGTIYIPQGTIDVYSNASNWSAFADRFVEISTEE